MDDRAEDRRDRGHVGRRTRVSSIALVVFVLAAGCGGDTTPDSQGTTTTDSPATTAGDSASACELITAVDIQAAVHVTVGEAKSSNNGSVTICSFETADKSTIVNLSRYEPVSDLLKNTLEADPAAKPLAGVGDEAVLQIKIGQLTMRVGEIGIALSVIAVPSEAALVQLARTIAGRM